MYAIGDERRTWQVLTNLLTNALKYSHGDGRRGVGDAGPDTRCVIGVRDGGPGIALEDQERIFDRFTRLPHEDATPGSGLGLFIARSLVEAQGGTISVSSSEGEGATFSVALPGGLGDHGAHPHHRRRPRPPRGRPHTARTGRARPGHRGGGRPRAGLTAVEAEAPELVLLDIDMPGPSGLDVLPELVRLAPAARVVILSNFPRRLHGEQARLRGAAGYVEKRVPLRDLVREILLAAAIAETALEVAAELPADPSSVRTARTLVREALGDAGDDVLFALELLVSEVVTNAVTHAGSAPRIEAQLDPADDPGRRVRRRARAARSTGCPTRTVRAAEASTCSTVWPRGGAPSPPTAGKVVWFELDRT